MERQDLRKAGLKVTSPRLKVLEILDSASTRHLSAEAIYRALLVSGEQLGLATVYRVLTQFERAGLVTRHNFESGTSVFELADIDQRLHDLNRLRQSLSRARATATSARSPAPPRRFRRSSWRPDTA